MGLTDWVTIGKVLFGSAGALGLLKLIIEKYDNYKKREKRKKDLSHTISSFRNIEQIFNSIISIGQDYNCSYVHIAAIHNGGKRMNELSEKKITIKTEHKSSQELPRMKPNWRDRDIDFEWFPLLNKVLDDGCVYIADLSKTNSQNDSGLKLMYDTNKGNEFFISKIDWVGDSLILLIIQRDSKTKLLGVKEKAFINYKAKELIGLFSNAKYFLEGSK